MPAGHVISLILGQSQGKPIASSWTGFSTRPNIKISFSAIAGLSSYRMSRGPKEPEMDDWLFSSTLSSLNLPRSESRCSRLASTASADIWVKPFSTFPCRVSGLLLNLGLLFCKHTKCLKSWMSLGCWYLTSTQKTRPLPLTIKQCLSCPNPKH